MVDEQFLDHRHALRRDLVGHETEWVGKAGGCVQPTVGGALDARHCHVIHGHTAVNVGAVNGLHFTSVVLVVPHHLHHVVALGVRGGIG